MRTAIALFLLTGATVGSYSQQPAVPEGPPDAVVLKQSWSKERIAWEKDPFGGPEDASNLARFRVLRDRTRTDGSILRERQEREILAAKEKPSPPPRYAFSYKIIVHNTGPKTIKEIDWDYSFTDAATGEQLGRHEFTSVEKIGPGKRKELSVLVSAPPTKKISVYTLGKGEHDGIVEKTLVVRILFDDDTVWNSR